MLFPVVSPRAFTVQILAVFVCVCERERQRKSVFVCFSVYVLPEGTHSCDICVPPPSAYLTDRRKAKRIKKNLSWRMG